MFDEIQPPFEKYSRIVCPLRKNFLNYKDYLDNFIIYIQINNLKLYNLEMMISASNSRRDFKKFNLDYNIVIGHKIHD